MSEILVDTNLWIYAIDEDSQFNDKAQSLLFESESDLFTTSRNLAEFLAVVTRGEDPALSTADALDSIQDIVSICRVLHSNSSTLGIFYDLLDKYQPKGLKVHDFDIASIGLGHGINRIATVNREDFDGIEEIEVVTL